MDDFGTRQASIKSVLTCGICNKMCRKITIIEECCHRFCKKCITRKITEEKLHVCPVCSEDLGANPLQKIRPDHQIQHIRDIFSAKRKEFIELGLIEDNSKKGETKKLAHADDDDDDNDGDNMLIDSPMPPPPPPAATAAAVASVATSSRRKEKSISALVNATPVDDQVSVQQNVSSRGRGRRRRGNSRNARRFQDSSKFINVEVNTQMKGDQPGSSSIPILSGKAIGNKQQVESAAYVAESSKNDTISKKTKSTEPLDGMNDLLEPLNTLVTKGVPSSKSKSKEPIPKFTPLINLDDDDEDEDDDDGDEEYVPTSKTREHKVSRQNVVHQKEEKKTTVVPAAAAAAPSSSTNNNTDKGKGKKGRRGRKKKEISNIPPPAATVVVAAAAAGGAGAGGGAGGAGAGAGAGGGGGAGGGSSSNVAQARVTHEAAATSSGSRLSHVWFTLVAANKQGCPSPLPPIPTRYIKINNVTMPVSYIKKYLAQKLRLQSEDEVEIRMLGILIRPELPLYQLADLWVRAAEQQQAKSGTKMIKVGDSAEDFVMILTYARSYKPQA